jgi:putative endonuclease
MSKKRGDFGENIACVFLCKHRYVILFKNFYTRFGEIDIIAHDSFHDQLVFVEVKTLVDNSKTAPEESLNKYKFQKVRKAALEYIRKTNKQDDNYRFDSISIRIYKKYNKIYIRHIKGFYY